MHVRNLLTVSLVAMAASVYAGAAAPAPTSAPATEPASQPAAFQATDKDALAKAAGATAIVTGTVSRTNWYNDEILFINFKGTERGDFTVIARQESRDVLDKAFTGDFAKAIDGKKITVTGKVVLYRDHPEIIVSKPEQVTILPDDKDAAGTEPAK